MVSPTATNIQSAAADFAFRFNLRISLISNTCVMIRASISEVANLFNRIWVMAIPFANVGNSLAPF